MWKMQKTCLVVQSILGFITVAHAVENVEKIASEVSLKVESVQSRTFEQMEASEAELLASGKAIEPKEIPFLPTTDYVKYKEAKAAAEKISRGLKGNTNGPLAPR